MKIGIMNDNLDSYEDFEEFIQLANKSCNWLVLRNFEYLPNEFFENDKDVDVLCDDLENFVKTMKLSKKSWGVSAYQTIIDGKPIPFDVRFLGDGYYDKLWQYKMLDNKIFTADGVPRMNDKDYFYSLIYHSKIQKHEFREIYKIRLLNLSKSLTDVGLSTNNIEDDKFIASKLNDFMKLNHYIYTTPVDFDVPKNNVFFDLLENSVKYDIIYNLPFKLKILKFIPTQVLKIIPFKVKKIIKRVIRWN